MEVKQKLYPHTVLCRLQYENGYLYEGEIMAELPREEATESAVAVYMTGAKRQGGAENE